MTLLYSGMARECPRFYPPACGRLVSFCAGANIGGAKRALRRGWRGGLRCCLSRLGALCGACGRAGDRAPRPGTLRAQLGRQRLDFAFDPRARSVGCETEIVRVLEIQPERCAGAEVACKPQCRFRRDGALEQRAAAN